MRRATACALLLALALAGGGCGSNSSERDDAAAAARARAEARAHARRMEIGRRVFTQRCGTCHTLGGRRFTQPIIEWEAPNLDEVKLKRHYVRYRVEFGGPAMASFTAELSRAEYRALIDYVTETAGGNVRDDGDQPAALLAQGKQVFAQQCAGCHAIAGRAATGRPTYPGMDFNLIKPSERWVIKRIKTGVLPDEPEPVMPSFRGRLSDAQMRAVAAYVSAVAKEGPEAREETSTASP
ncbi:MAG: c-type cytochrome [Conexibacter sp.]